MALIAVVAVGIWLGVRHKGGGTTKPVATGAVAVSEQGLRTIANTLGQPIYWAGRKAGVTYELTQSPDGRIYVRYLPQGVAVGTRAPYLTVATYPITNAYVATSGVAQRRGSVKIDAGGGVVAFYGTTRPTNVYEAHKGSDYQIEVYSPSAKQAQQLVAGRLIRPLGTATGIPTTTTATTTTPPTGAVAATVADIKALAGTLGRPVYWAGGESQVTYELTETPDGRVYVRYLPAGVKVGSNTPYLTVATYPLTGAYATTSATAAQPATVKIAVGGGVAFYSRAHPTSVYVAFQGTDEQIEVFDPSPAQAHKLVASGRIKPVS
ncbi:MAG: hypothetical protein M3O94_09355 [Actinomycetota bacterium]|nr:hypothetical protein [Actinomycetota bacterium]